MKSSTTRTSKIINSCCLLLFLLSYQSMNGMDRDFLKRVLNKGSDFANQEHKIVEKKENFFRKTGFRYLINTEHTVVAVKETPFLFCGFTWKKRVETLSFIFGQKLSKTYIISGYLLSNDEENEELSLLDNLEKAEKESIERGVWNIYKTTHTSYCLKTKLLALATSAVGINAALYYCPAYYTSFFKQFFHTS